MLAPLILGPEDPLPPSLPLILEPEDPPSSPPLILGPEANEGNITLTSS